MDGRKLNRPDIYQRVLVFAQRGHVISKLKLLQELHLYCEALVKITKSEFTQTWSKVAYLSYLW